MLRFVMNTIIIILIVKNIYIDFFIAFGNHGSAGQLVIDLFEIYFWC